MKLKKLDLTKEEVRFFKNVAGDIARNMGESLTVLREKIVTVSSDSVNLAELFIFCRNLMQSQVMSLNDSKLQEKLVTYLDVFSSFDKIDFYYEDYCNHKYDRSYYKERLKDYISPYKENMIIFIYFVVGKTQIFTKHSDLGTEDDIFDLEDKDIDRILKKKNVPKIEDKSDLEKYFGGD